MRVVVTSDTHNLHRHLEIPEGDLFIHCGDLTGRGSLDKLRAANDWIAGLPHRHKVFVPGNHDFCFQLEPKGSAQVFTAATVLIDAGLEVEGFKLWGSPWQPWFHNWAFNLPRGERLREVWERVPSDTDILVTHSPPAGILDETSRGEQVGCADLREALRRIRPKLHVFGHIHEAYGTHEEDGTIFGNASFVDFAGRLDREALVFDL